MLGHPLTGGPVRWHKFIYRYKDFDRVLTSGSHNANDSKLNLLYCSVWQVLLILLKSKLLATPGGEELEESQILPDTVINLFKG